MVWDQGSGFRSLPPMFFVEDRCENVSGVDFRVLRIGLWGFGLGMRGVEFRVSDLGCRISGWMGGLDVEFRVGWGGWMSNFGLDEGVTAEPSSTKCTPKFLVHAVHPASGTGLPHL